MQVGLEKVIALLTAGVLAGPVLAQDLGKANGVIRSFDGLSDGQRQDVLNFLRSL